MVPAKILFSAMAEELIEGQQRDLERTTRRAEALSQAVRNLEMALESTQRANGTLEV